MPAMHRQTEGELMKQQVATAADCARRTARALRVDAAVRAVGQDPALRRPSVRSSCCQIVDVRRPRERPFA